MPPSAFPPGVGEVGRRVRGLGDIPRRRLFRYLRPHLLPFSLAIGGLIVGSGTHDDLLARDGLYAWLYRLQFTHVPEEWTFLAGADLAV